MTAEELIGPLVVKSCSMAIAFEIKISCSNCKSVHQLILSEAAISGDAACDACRTVLYHVQALAGYVYLLTNPRMPGIIKIGNTRRSVRGRVEELNAATGVPAPFAIEAIFAVYDPNSAEAKIHKCLDSRRVPGREFFEIEAGEAIRLAEAELGSPPIYVSNRLKRQNMKCARCGHMRADHAVIKRSGLSAESCDRRACMAFAVV